MTITPITRPIIMTLPWLRWIPSSGLLWRRPGGGSPMAWLLHYHFLACERFQLLLCHEQLILLIFQYSLGFVVRILILPEGPLFFLSFILQSFDFCICLVCQFFLDLCQLIHLLILGPLLFFVDLCFIFLLELDDLFLEGLLEILLCPPESLCEGLLSLSLQIRQIVFQFGFHGLRCVCDLALCLRADSLFHLLVLILGDCSLLSCPVVYVLCIIERHSCSADRLCLAGHSCWSRWRAAPLTAGRWLTRVEPWPTTTTTTTTTTWIPHRRSTIIICVVSLAVIAHACAATIFTTVPTTTSCAIRWRPPSCTSHRCSRTTATLTLPRLSIALPTLTRGGAPWAWGPASISLRAAYTLEPDLAAKDLCVIHLP
mmetsp:Transcript_151737/g.279738  ORF Transcript_151737/g.279738 Transcript_151737/m.279738 type:complete len:371 (-) Transcript_151737:732-1844(-)